MAERTITVYDNKEVVVLKTDVLQVETSTTNTVLTVEPKVLLVEVSSGPVIHVDVGIPGPAGPGSGGSYVASVFVQEVTSQGIVQGHVWNVPGKHLEAVSTDSSDVTVRALVEGGTAIYQPTVLIAGVTASLVETEHPRLFIASANISLDEGVNTIEVESSAGGKDTVIITKVSGGPSIRRYRGTNNSPNTLPCGPASTRRYTYKY